MRRTRFHLIRFNALLGALVCTALLAASRIARAATAEGPSDADAPIIVLVPGFFNSFTTSTTLHRLWPYFSQAVVQTVASRGSPVMVVDTLLPVANIEDNGNYLIQYLDQAAAQFPGRKMLLIAHSAGGLYVLQALTMRPDLPVQTVVTIGTPYTGVEFVDRLRADHPALQKILKYIDLNSVKQFEASLIAPLLQTFVVPKGIRWVAIGGTRPACHIFNCNSIDHLSWILSLTQSLMTEPSDGVVTIDSALGKGVRLKDSAGGPLDLERWSDFNFTLEHWEMVEDGRGFALIGEFDPGRIAQRQRDLFTELLNRLMPEVQGPQKPNTPIVRAPPAPPAP